MSEETKRLKDGVGIKRTSRLDNGKVKVYYTDASEDELTIQEFLNDFREENNNE